MAGQPALLEREPALGAAEGALRAVTGGRAALVVVEGEAGLGKSSLLLELRSRIEPVATVMTARPAEHEAGYALGVVRQLLGDAVAALPAAGRERLAQGPALVALRALGDDPVQTPPPDPFAMADGLYWLAAGLAAEGPLVLLVDDAHWADPPSLRALGHLARRFDDLPIGLVLASRPDEPDAPADLLDAVRLDPRTRVVRLRPLSRAATTTLAGGSAALGAACHRATAGNPLYLRELLAGLDGGGPEAAAGATPATIARHVGRRVAAVGDTALALAEALALTGDGTPLHHAAAVAGLPLPDALAVAHRLVAIDVLAEAEPARFAHPVVLASVRAALSPERREALLRRAVEVLDGSDAPHEQVAGYLLQLSPGAGAGVGALRAAAAAAMSRGAPDAARRYLLRALQEPPPDADRAAVLHALGTAEQLLADPGYAERLRAAIADAPDARTRAAWTAQLAAALGFQGDISDALRLLEDALDADWLPDEDARDLVGAHLLGMAWGSADGSVRTPELLRRFDARPPRVPATARFVAGMRAGRMDHPLAEHVALAEAAHDGTVGPEGFFGRIMATGALVFADRFDRAQERLDQLLDQTRTVASRVDISATHVMFAELAYARGDLEGCLRHVERGATPFDAGAPTGTRAYVTAIKLRALLEQGGPEPALACLAEAGPEPWLPTSHAQFFLRAAQGRVLHALARHAEAADAFAAARRCLTRFSGTTWSPLGFDGGWEEPLALVACGRAAAAHALLEDALPRTAAGPPRGLALTLRAAALLLSATGTAPAGLDVAAADARARIAGPAGTEAPEGPAADPRTLLELAARLLAGAGAQLELARTLLELGTVLRRSGSRAAAREPLGRALDLARDCGAAPLAARARDELAATGARPRRDRLNTGRDALTPSEARLARLAAEGRTNREIAQALYLSQKTVEMHLGRAYRKLGITRRTELADALTVDPTT